MSAAETIAAAIQKLEELQSSSTRGPWTAAAGFDDDRNLEYSLIAQQGFEFFDVLDAVNEDIHKASADADLVEVLHGTIDAQLILLSAGRRELEQPIRDAGPRSIVAAATAFAEAILGGAA